MQIDPTIQLAGMIGIQEILVILLIVLIFFGGKKIPELMKGLGKGMKEYKKAMSGIEEELSTMTDDKDDSPKTQESTIPNETSHSENETKNS